MKLIVGLGNPDKEYENTFHNLGFMCVEETARKLGVSFGKEKCKAILAEYGVGENKIILAKPLTYMNNSGLAVSELLSFYKIELKDLIVAYDDYDLNKGFLRIRENGSAGTHNGMRSIIKEIGSGEFTRIRVGFKPQDNSQIPLINLVLSKISKEDKPIFERAISFASDAMIDFANGKDIQYLMQKYNGKAN
ncbi:MAG: aminoacyl-tRNA hydrolase [Clostridia bacterium]|nr:aminoacyl-tRNA hydrolase [Clostridia bacterium]